MAKQKPRSDEKEGGAVTGYAHTSRRVYSTCAGSHAIEFSAVEELTLYEDTWPLTQRQTAADVKDKTRFHPIPLLDPLERSWEGQGATWCGSAWEYACDPMKATGPLCCRS